MGRFKFSLEAVLKVNNLKKKQAETEFTRAKEYLDQQYRVLSDMQKEMDLIAANMANMVLNGTKVYNFKLYADYTQAMRGHIKQQEQTVKRAEKQVQDIMARLVDLMKRINVLNQLKEKKYREYIFELEKNQQKIIDEFTGFKVYRQGGLLHG
ncbi:MAG: flagellar export protein FliJ [Clostridiales bacterium]|nr:flagellar export protein FliJ [Clostridiales bacterium]